MQKTIHRLATLLVLLSGLALVLMMVHVTLDVLGKYVLKSPIPGTAETVAAYYMISVVFLPLAYVEIMRGSIVVEMLYDKVGTGARWAMDVVGALASIAFYGFLTWLGMGLAHEAWQVREYVDGLWRVIVWPSRFLIPLGMGVATLAVFLRLCQLLAVPGRKASLGDAPANDIG